MKKCYVAMGKEASRKLSWFLGDMVAMGKKEYLDHKNEFFFIDMEEENLNDVTQFADNRILLEPVMDWQEEGAEKEFMNRIMGRKAAARTAEYARKFDPHINEDFFDTDSVELTVIVSSEDSFLQGTAQDIIEFLAVKLKCTYPNLELHLKVLVYSDEFTFDGLWDPICDRFALTKFFLDRYMDNRDKMADFLDNDVIYVIDCNNIGSEEKMRLIGMEKKELSRHNKWAECMAGGVPSDVDLLKLERNHFGWKE